MLRFIVRSTCSAAVIASDWGTPAATRAETSASAVSFSITCSPTPGVCQSFAAVCHSYSASSGAAPAAQVRTSVGSSETARTTRSPPQSWPTRSIGPSMRRNSASSQSQYASFEQSKPAGIAQPKPGRESVTTSSRRSRRTSAPQTRCVSGTPCTRTAGISGLVPEEASRVAEWSAPDRLSAGALDRLGQRALGEHTAEVRLVLDGALKVRLHVDTFGGLLRGRLDRRGVELLARAARLDAFRAHGLGAGAGDTDRRLGTSALAVERDGRGDAHDGEARGRMRELHVRGAGARRQHGHAHLDENLVLADRGGHQPLEPVVHLHGASPLGAF